jgi:HD-GYP domain-containing protein (c-di-GMP phosphodiesterase class II)/DNA-binding CsgD family transcriptional regulator
MSESPVTQKIRLAELMAALSIATDLGMGQPLEYALSSCILSVRLGEEIGLSENTLRQVYYLALLRYIGCNAETHEMARLVGDELILRQGFAKVDMGKPAEVLTYMFQHMSKVNQGHPVRMVGMIARAMVMTASVMKEAATAHCEVAQRLAERLGFQPDFQMALGQAYERWDGKGIPFGLKGDAIFESVRVVTLAQDVITFYRLFGADEALSMLRERSGRAYDPAMVECFVQHSSSLLEGLDSDPDWQTILELEPGEQTVLSEDQLDISLRALADFSDLKSPYLLNHSSRLAELVTAAAACGGLPPSEITQLRRAAWVHDIGRTGISAAIWNKPGPLIEKEWEQVRLHPYYTNRVLARPTFLAELGELASSHHERLDGKGYFKGLPANLLSFKARLLAASDMYQAMTEERPYRPALTAEQAAAELKAQVKNGRLDSESVQAVLEAAGHSVRVKRKEWPAGLTSREVEVLRLIARGNSVRDTAARLHVSPKTVEHHIQHIYTKLNVSTRAAATLFAMEHDLLNNPPL